MFTLSRSDDPELYPCRESCCRLKSNACRESCGGYLYTRPVTRSLNAIRPSISNPARPAINRSVCATSETRAGVLSERRIALSAVGSLYPSPFIFPPSIIVRLYHRNAKHRSTRSDQQPDNKTNHTLSLTLRMKKDSPKTFPLCYSL